METNIPVNSTFFRQNLMILAKVEALEKTQMRSTLIPWKIPSTSLEKIFLPSLITCGFLTDHKDFNRPSLNKSIRIFTDKNNMIFSTCCLFL